MSKKTYSIQNCFNFSIFAGAAIFILQLTITITSGHVSISACGQYLLSLMLMGMGSAECLKEKDPKKSNIILIVSKVIGVLALLVLSWVLYGHFRNA